MWAPSRASSLSCYPVGGVPVRPSGGAALARSERPRGRLDNGLKTGYEVVSLLGHFALEDRFSTGIWSTRCILLGDEQGVVIPGFGRGGEPDLSLP